MKYLAYILVLILFWSCSTTKNLPEDEYLLDNFHIKSDTKDIDVSTLENFVRQKPNSSFPILGKLRVGIYNSAGQDSSRVARLKRRIGEAPVLFSARQAAMSATQIEKELSNQGYLNAKVDTTVEKKEKKATVNYVIESNTPYRIRNYKHTIGDTTAMRILARTKRYSLIKPGNLFDKSTLEEERTRTNSSLRNSGYYRINKNNLYHEADTTLNSHQVDLFLSIYQIDSLEFKRYKIRNITVLSGYDPSSDDNKEYFQHPDTTYYKGLTIVRGTNNFLRNSAISRYNFITPGQYYSESRVNRTFSSFNGIGAVRQTNITFRPVPITQADTIGLLDAQITLAPSNIHWFQTGLEGTNTAGDIGVAPSISYQHQNIFNGSEIFAIRLKAAYEFIQGRDEADILNQNFYEFGVETSLAFPQFLFPFLKKRWREQPAASTRIALGLNNQRRPEYFRQFFNATISYRWSSHRNKINHSFDFWEINYVRMPYMSQAFQDLLTDPVLKEAYKDQLIARTGYNITYTSSNNRGNRFPRNLYTIRTGIDIAGILPHLVTTLTNAERDSSGQYQILGIPYAEYIKADFSFAHTRRFDKKKSIAYHIGVGAANPFGNSNILPFERRYFSGGANSVRGWNSRRLGPGSYQTDALTSFINQAGDIKLDLSIEYRAKISPLIELATFIDGGNIWTIRNYEGQQGGLFKLSSFYKEIAVSYGCGLRLDFDFLLVRLDFGIRAYDPGRDEGDRFVMFKTRISRDVAWHFAIGYPF